MGSKDQGAAAIISFTSYSTTTIRSIFIAII